MYSLTEYFGFTDEEVREMLEYYELSDHYEDIREWYDGYQFGKAEVYCAMDVIIMWTRCGRSAGRA